MKTVKVTNNLEETKVIKTSRGMTMLIEPGKSINFVVSSDNEVAYYKDLQNTLNSTKNDTTTEPEATEEVKDEKIEEVVEPEATESNESPETSTTDESSTEVEFQEATPKKRTRRKKAE